MKRDLVGGVGRVGRPVAALLIMVLAALTGCQPAAPPAQEILPRSELLARYNARATAIAQLSAPCHIAARFPKMDRNGIPIKGQYETWSLDGTFVFRKQRDLYLVGEAFSSPVFGLGSNSEMYWFWVRPGMSTEYFGRYDGPGAKKFAIRPDYLLETLGVYPVTTDVDVWAFRRGDDRDIIQIMDVDVSQPEPNFSPDKVAVVLGLREEIHLERVHHDPVEVRLYDPAGEPILVSQLLDYAQVGEVRLPTKLVYRFVEADALFTLSLRDISLTKKLKDAAFAYRPGEVKTHRNLDEPAAASVTPPAPGAEKK